MIAVLIVTSVVGVALLWWNAMVVDRRARGRNG